MKKILSILMVAFFATSMISCSEESDSSSSHSGSPELANTVWRYDNPSDSYYYGAHVTLTVSFGATNQITFRQQVNDATNTMTGTYDFSSGSGTAYVKKTEGEDQNEYRISFTVSSNTMVWKLNQDYTLTKIQ